MAKIVELDYILNRRESASEPALNRVQENLSWDAEESTGLVTTRIADGVSAIELSMGQITVGTFLYLSSSIPIELYIGDPLSVTSITGTFFVIATVTGDEFTEVHVKNNNGATTVASVAYLIAGDPT